MPPLISFSRLDNRYNDGRGVAQNDREAVRWYRKAADKGYARAQCNLGFKYDQGEGVDKDDAQAVYWYRLAAEQGKAALPYRQEKKKTYYFWHCKTLFVYNPQSSAPSCIERSYRHEIVSRVCSS
jgi:TPR repeat protein